ncbi:flagellar motor stator protein MotA (plasmid) [Pontibacillus sp. ALD_SL1]|uniref:flagellar motor stator protein MotA n=1 Tax=Pontibacillus sp. ALD_SL1 TaxID=2777185 RepID=UPI001A96E279|nr:flagellar motor stator protein MotA [Pontibacillus sp. ALD_SL1]QST03110.1 flagellar motor stator protein MotA [Pontibacillus sp. ALD_SL1]
MDKTSIFGLIIGFGALIGGLMLKGSDPSVLINPAALVIIMVGTAASLCIAFPGSEIKKFPTLLKIAFTEEKRIPERELLPVFVEWASIIRRDGIKGIEEQMDTIQHPFLKKGVDLIMEGKDSQELKKILEEDLEATEERHHGFASIFTQAGTYAPTLGVLGAVMGLIGALGHLDDIEKLGYSIAAAFVATLYGIFTGYVLWHPMANKLKRKSQTEIGTGYFIIKGLTSLLEDGSPLIVEQKLKPLLPSKERDSLQAKPTEAEEG